jgi:hypothetical protein
MNSIILAAFCCLLGLACVLAAGDTSLFEKPIVADAGPIVADSGQALSNRVLVATLPRRFASAEYITPEQVRALTWKGGETVKNACLSCPEPDVELFPADAKITFMGCNLDNVLIPDGCKLVDCYQRPVEQQRFRRAEVVVDGKTDIRDVLLVKGSTTETQGTTTDGETCTVVKFSDEKDVVK